MGNLLDCCNCNLHNINDYSNDFINSLNITKLGSLEFFGFMERNPPLIKLEENYNEFLKSNNSETHKIYVTELKKKSKNYFFLSLIFLLKSDAKEMAINYEAMIQEIKKGEISKEQLENFKENDYTILQEVLKYYIRMVSLDIITALESSKTNPISEENMQKFHEMYNDDSIESLAKDLMIDCQNPFVNFEEFFQKNFISLKPKEIRESLQKQTHQPTRSYTKNKMKTI